jgi:hypothetical protein
MQWTSIATRRAGYWGVVCNWAAVAAALMLLSSQRHEACAASPSTQ